MEHPGQNPNHKQKWSLFFLEQMFHNAAGMQCREHQRCSRGPPLEVNKTALEHPSVLALVGSQDSDVPWVTEQIYRGEYLVAPSMFTHAEQDFMREL